jgi:Fibronectin type III domain
MYLAVLLTITTAVGASAQPQLVVTNARYVAGIDLERLQVMWVVPQNLDASPPYAVVATSDGRFAIWSTSSHSATGTWSHSLVVRDSLTRMTSRLAAPGAARKLLAHPRRLQLFALFAGGPLYVADLTGTRAIDACAAPADMSLTLDGGQLFLLCDREVIVVATDTLAVIRKLQPGVMGNRIAVNADGSRLVTIRNVSNDSDPAVILVNAIQGEVIATAPRPATGDVNLLQANADGTEFAASFKYYRDFMPRGYAGTTVAFSFSVLQEVGRTFFVDSLAFSPDGVMAFGGQNGGRGSSLYFQINLPAWTWSFDRVYYIDDWSLPGAALAVPPLAPANVHATVSGQSVSLTWDLLPHSSMATSYALDARLTPAGPVIATLRSSDAALNVRNVPPGTYYVTVRGINYAGQGPQSPQIQVTVQ